MRPIIPGMFVKADRVASAPSTIELNEGQVDASETLRVFALAHEGDLAVAWQARKDPAQPDVDPGLPPFSAHGTRLAMELPRASGGKPFCARQRGYRTPPCGSRLPPRRAPAPRLPAEVPVRGTRAGFARRRARARRRQPLSRPSGYRHRQGDGPRPRARARRVR